MTTTEPADVALAFADPVGVAEIQDRMGVVRGTVNQWRERPNVAFPSPRWTVGRRPVWDWTDILIWCEQTGRYPDPDAPPAPLHPHRPPVERALADPVGVAEIHVRMGVVRGTVNEWRVRPNVGFPEPRWSVGRRAVWDWTDILAWCEQTGRQPAKNWRS